jgi:membrane protease YdiL (CAAX protease family)
MRSDCILAAFRVAPGYGATLFFLLYLLLGIYVYISLIRQIGARASLPADGPMKKFGLPEALLAGTLILFLSLSITASISRPPADISARNLLANLLLTMFIVLFIVTFLQLRGFDLSSLAGLFKIGFVRALITGIILLLAAYPLILFANLITQDLFGGGSSKQNIVELFSGAPRMSQRIIIIVFAVAIAPVVEEFLFRFFLYGVIKRYFGRLLGVTANALLFAAAHAHFPSFVPLFILGSCFTIAYEWSGSLLVAMTMHSLFNSVTLIALAFPELLSQ